MIQVLIGLKKERELVFGGVTFGLAINNGLAIASSRLRLFVKNRTISSIKAKCACKWEKGIIASDGLNAFVWDGKELKVMRVGEHSKVMAFDEGVMVCTWSNCKALNWEMEVLWEVKVDTPGVPAHVKGYWYLPSKDGLLVIKDGKVVNEVDVRGGFKVVACEKGLAVANSEGVTLLTLKEPESPEPLTFLEAEDVLFDIDISEDCSYLALATSRGLKVISDEVYELPSKEAITAVSFSEFLTFSEGEYTNSEVFLSRVFRLKEEEVGEAEWVRACDGKVLPIKDNCVEGICLEQILDVDCFPLIVGGEGANFGGKALDVGLVTSVATDGKGALLCNDWSCSYYEGGAEKWSLELPYPKAKSFGDSFLIAYENGLAIVKEGKVVKERVLRLGTPLVVSTSGGKALVSFSNGTVVVDKDLSLMWAIPERSFHSSLDNDLILIVDGRAKVFALGDPFPLDLGKASSGAIAKDIYLVKNNKLIRVERPSLNKRPLPKLVDVIGFEDEVRGIARGCSLAVATPSKSYILGEKIKELEGFNDVTYFDGKFVFVNEEKALITDCTGSFRLEVETGFGIGRWVSANEKGFVTCGEAGCVLHSWGGEANTIAKGASGKPLALEKDFLIPTPFGIASTSGKELSLREPRSLGLCGDLLLVGGEDAIFLVTKELKFVRELNGFNSVIALNCNVVVEESGRVIMDKEYFFPRLSSALTSERLYLGSADGLLYIVEVNPTHRLTIQ